MFNCNAILIQGWRLDLFINKIQFIHFLLELFKPVNNWSDKNSETGMLPMIDRKQQGLLLIQLLLCHFNLIDKKVHYFNCLLLHAGLDTVPFCQIIKSLQHVNPLFNSCYLLKRKVYDVLVHNIKLFHTCFETIIFVMPIWSFNIQYLLFFTGFELLDQFSERGFYFE